MSVFVCGKCRFSFERAGMVEECPNCGHRFIRNATEDERLEYKRNRAEAEKNDKQGKGQ